MQQGSVARERRVWGFCLLVVALVLARLLSFPYAPEDWTNLALVGERSFLQCIQPFVPTESGAGVYPYYRPLWYTWIKLASLMGLSGGMAHSMVLIAHLGAVFLVYRIARHFGFSVLQATVMSLLVGLAPGTQGALCWLPAGNKAFALFFLLFSSYCILTLKETSRIFLFFPLFALPALASSENAYMMLLLFPLATCMRQGFRQDGGARRWLVPAGVLVLCLVFFLWHLSQLPQSAAASHSRVEELLLLIRADVFAWTLAVAQNMGRFFMHGLGLGEDYPRIGVVALIVIAVLAAGLARARREKRSYALLCALVFFFVLNFPASFFSYELSRHHAYLPAIGAATILANLLFLVPRRRLVHVLVPVVCFLVFVDLGQQQEWSRYLHHCQRVFESSEQALPSVPGPGEGKVIMLNVPLEYRAAFRLRFGAKAGVLQWPDVLILRSRTSYVPPKDIPLPLSSGCTLLEYDGERIQRGSFAEFTNKRKLPPAWFVNELEPFPDRILSWGSILAARQDLDRLPWSFEAEPGATAAKAPAERSVEVLAHGSKGNGKGSPYYYFWEFRAKSDGKAWLVLSWTPVFMPSTERVSPLFHLRRLSWFFRTKITELGKPDAELEMPVKPVLCILPALRLPPGEQRLRVELIKR